MARERAAIVGAGPAGLAVAEQLQERGIDPLVVERGPGPGTSWQGRHDHLRLNTHRLLSHEPRRRIPRRTGTFPGRDDYVRYLCDYASRLRIRPATDVTGIERDGEHWRLETSGGPIAADHVVVATGADTDATRPRWPGEDGFTGRLIHAAELRELQDADGADVLVIGAGNSGVDLMNHLVTRPTGRLWLSARRGTSIIPARLGGIPLHPMAVAGRRLPVRMQDAMLATISRLAFGDLSRHGLPRPDVGALTRFRRDHVAPAIDDGFVRALKEGRVTMRPAVAAFDGSDVRFADGTTCAPDLVVCATGYRPGLERLAGHLVELDRLGLPPGEPGTPAAGAPSLWFFVGRGAYGNLVDVRQHARRIATAIAAA